MTTVAPNPAADIPIDTPDNPDTPVSPAGSVPADGVAAMLDDKPVNAAIAPSGLAEPGPPPSAWDPLTAMATGASEPAARFRYDVRSGDWWWSPGMFDLHGLIEGEVEPTTDLLLSHKHPDDLAGTEQTLRRVLATGKPFCCRHRVVDNHGRLREVLSVGEAVCASDGEITSVRGYFVDLTDAFAAASAQERSDVAAQRHRVVDPVIEQAKGILVAAFRLTPEAALELLVWRSEETRVDLAVVSRGLVTEFSSMDDDDLSAARRACLHLGLTALDED